MGSAQLARRRNFFSSFSDAIRRIGLFGALVEELDAYDSNLENNVAWVTQ